MSPDRQIEQKFKPALWSRAEENVCYPNSGPILTWFRPAPAEARPQNAKHLLRCRIREILPVRCPSLHKGQTDTSRGRGRDWEAVAGRLPPRPFESNESAARRRNPRESRQPHKWSKKSESS